MTMSHDIHGYGRRLEVCRRNIRRAAMNQGDRTEILAFLNLLIARNLNLGRVTKYGYHLEQMAIHLHSSRTSFEAADSDTIIELASWIYSMKNSKTLEDCRDSTKRDYVQVLKSYFQWLRAPREEYAKWQRKHIFPSEVEMLSTTIKRNKRVVPTDLFTDEEITRMISAATRPMMRAYVALSYEIGPRIGELLKLRVGDISFVDNDMFCMISESKTDPRNLYLCTSAAYVAAWLELHPAKGDPNAPLFVNQSNNGYGDAWGYYATRKDLKKLADRAGVRKRDVYHHLFRHSAATRDARLGMNEEGLRKKYGWSDNSTMPSTYVHLAQNDLTAMTKRLYMGKEAEELKPQMIPCPRCHIQNPPSMAYCGTCSAPLGMNPNPTLQQRMEEQIASERKKMELERKQLEEKTRMKEEAWDRRLEGLQAQVAELLTKRDRKRETAG